MIELMYQKYYEEIRDYLCFNMRCSEEASDIAQDVFIKLSKQEISEIDNVRAWLYKVAINYSRNRFKRATLFLKYINYSMLNENQYEEIKLSDEEQKFEILKRSIQKLNEEDRTLILLYRDELSYKEISEITGIKFSSVGKKLSRAINKLKKIVGE
ncbi:MAG: sigma-70 family RNA polymerase sigma factor [Candidatus Delongbacteria bacterium]|nr:sigma-70 family RNA polymerase sigma factor [Candidatus Delongbacteria bacterium]MBN2834245.1 sigma-70 family RNA polymerase sigma factor [Candidatus Delongbacteria bacterium]